FDDPRIAFLLQEKFPFVAFGRSNPERDISFVDVDGAQGITMVVEHLLRLGHRAIALLGWPEGSRVGQDRLAGYSRALNAAGISLREEWIARGEGSAAFGQRATARWLDGDCPPTAIVALDDWMAIGAMRAVQEKGLHVGTDIAITGFDDVPMASCLSPPLTSVRQPVWQVGQEVVRILTGLLNDDTPDPRQVLLAPRLVVRESSGPGRAVS
ncbi:MAG: substrate-binding domain-containing protein, partial [Rudaea sp.]